MMISLVIGKCYRALHNSWGYISVRFCEVSTAGWDKNLENGPKVLMSLSERWLCTGQEGFVPSKGNAMDFTEQVLTWPWQPNSEVSCLPKVESPQSNEHVALLPLVTKGFIRHLLFPLLLPLSPPGAVQTQSYLHHLCKIQAAMEKCLSTVPVVAFTVQLCPVL